LFCVIFHEKSISKKILVIFFYKALWTTGDGRNEFETKPRSWKRIAIDGKILERI
jgi:hypothetical protein